MDEIMDMQNLEAEFKERLDKHYNEMKWLYGEIYHGDEKAFDYFCRMLHVCYKQRKAELKKRDKERMESDRWYKDGSLTGMMMYVNAFAGDLKGVEEHLDYIEECGVNYLHLMPLLESPAGKSDGGYAVADFRKVQPELGTMKDFEHLADKCHERGISICLDFVMNHTSEDHEWARRARNGEKEFQDRYFMFDNWDIPNEFEKTVPQVFPQTAPGNFTWYDDVKKVVMTTFYPYQWDLNYANPTVFNDMAENMFYLMNRGVDVIRLDAVPYIWKKLGTTCRNLAEVHTLVRIMHMACDIVAPGTLLLGEVVMEPSKVVPYFGTVDKPECHMLYNVTTMASTWNTVATHDVRLLKHQLGQVFALPRQYTFLNYLRCHDDIGWGLDYDFLKQFGVEEVQHKKFVNDYFTGRREGSDMRGELYNDDPRLGDARLCGTTASLCGVEAAEYERNPYKLDRYLRLDEMLHAYMFTQSGIPVLYSGDEIAQLNDYDYHRDELKWDDSRYIHRGNMNWDDVKLRRSPRTRQGRMFKSIKKLEKIRAEHRVFDGAADVWLVETYNDCVLGIGRYYKGEKLIALFNFSDYDQTAWINENEWYTDLMTGDSRPARGVGIPAYGFVWLLTEFPDAAEDEVENKEKKAPVKKAAVKKTSSKKASEKKTAANKATTKKPAVKKTTAKKTTAKKAESAVTAEEKTVAKSTDEKKTVRKRTNSKKVKES
ncbi:alpha-amylase family glycosyl hydrolase [Lachnospiraceae bacterium C1.1]|nr:alpha-amylase family glycosyl hydrolase [Lachnospiraceae bacterium C1.1]